MKHGFKASAERMAVDVRAELGLSPVAPLCPWRLADHFGIIVFGPKDLPLAANDIHQLTVADPQSWSGLSVRDAGLTAVILNPTHPKARQRNTLMHEISHIHLKHVGSRVDVSMDGLLLVSDFSAEQEEEANWLAGAFLAPRDALLAARNAGKSAQQICNDYGISNELCVWRLRMTGIEAQLQHRRRKGV